jgi:acetate kinase
MNQMKNVLIINAGSSSLKYQVINMDDESILAKGIAERIGIGNSVLAHSPAGKDKVTIEVVMENHGDAMKAVISALTDSGHGVFEDMSSIVAVGHRVLHGGERFNKSMVVDEEVLDGIRGYIELGPLHNPANIKGIETCMEVMPGIPNVAVFDTSFHTTMPDYAYLYGIPYDAYKSHKIRKYGFHGTSHRYIALRAPKMLGLDPNHLKLITCHLGNGSSLAAVENGKCIDTSMGLTPLEGLIMGTRSGDIDPAAVPYLMQKYDMTAEETVTYLNKNSGMIGISGVSSDFRDLWDAAENGSEMARLALHMFNYRIKKYIGSYAAALNGVDVIAFAGGIGENDEHVRREICEGLGYLGVDFDENANHVHGKETVITKPGSKVTVAIVPTDEELMIARDTYEICCK